MTETKYVWIYYLLLFSCGVFNRAESLNDARVCVNTKELHVKLHNHNNI